MKLLKKEFNNTHGEKIHTTELLDIIAEIIADDVLKKTAMASPEENDV